MLNRWNFLKTGFYEGINLVWARQPDTSGTWTGAGGMSNGWDRPLLFLIRGAVAVVLLTPLIVMTQYFGGSSQFLPNTFFPFIVGKAVYAHALIEIAFGLWIVLALKDPTRRAPQTWLLLILALYTLVALLSAITGVSPQRSVWSTYERMQGVNDIAHWLIYVWVLTSVFRTWEDWRWLLNFNLGVSVLLGLLGLSQYFEVGVLAFLRATPRLDITLGNPTYVGAYMLVNVLIALGFLGRSFLNPATPDLTAAQQRRRRRARRRPGGQGGIPAETWWRVFWVSAVALDALILYLSGTRGAVVGLTAGLLAFAVGYAAWGQIRQLRTASLVLIAAVLGLTLVFVSVRGTAWFHAIADNNVMLRRLANTGIGDDSLRGRIDSAQVGLRGFAARPILGWGPENFTIAYDRYVTAEIIAGAATSFDQAHNKLIEELTTKGFLGFSSYVAMWLYMLWVVARRVRQQSAQDQVFTLFVGAVLAGYFVQNLFLFDTPGTVGQFYLLLGFVVYVDAGSEAPQVAVRAARQAKPEGGTTAPWRPNLLRSDASMVVALLVVGALVSLTVYFVNYRPYDGARSFLGTLDPSVGLEEKLELFDKSIGAFPPLANYLRIIMFNDLTRSWGNLTAEQAQAALVVAAREGLKARTGEPEEWRVYLPLAALYHRAAPRDGTLMQHARELVDEASRLSPERIEVRQMVVRQYMVEQNYEGALREIDSYLQKSPGAARHFQALRQQVVALSGTSTSSRLP